MINYDKLCGKELRIHFTIHERKIERGILISDFIQTTNIYCFSVKTHTSKYDRYMNKNEAFKYYFLTRWQS